MSVSWPIRLSDASFTARLTRLACCSGVVVGDGAVGKVTLHFTVRPVERSLHFLSRGLDLSPHLVYHKCISRKLGVDSNQSRMSAKSAAYVRESTFRLVRDGHVSVAFMNALMPPCSVRQLLRQRHGRRKDDLTRLVGYCRTRGLRSSEAAILPPDGRVPHLLLAR